MSEVAERIADRLATRVAERDDMLQHSFQTLHKVHQCRFQKKKIERYLQPQTLNLSSFKVLISTNCQSINVKVGYAAMRNYLALAAFLPPGVFTGFLVGDASLAFSVSFRGRFEGGRRAN